MQNYRKTVLSQYGNSPRIMQLIAEFNYNVDPVNNLNNFYKLIWNVETATGYGLDVWGRIVGVNRIVTIPAGGKFLGFDEATPVSADPFNQSPLYGGVNATDNYPISDDGFRTMIYAKALANISNCSIENINKILLLLFPNRGNCYCTDGRNMTMTYTFDFTLSAVEYSIVTQSGVLPKPLGVSVTVVTPP